MILESASYILLGLRFFVEWVGEFEGRCMVANAKQAALEGQLKKVGRSLSVLKEIEACS